MTPSTTTALLSELEASAEELDRHLETLRAAARAVNALGALASRVQGIAQDADFESPTPAQRQRLQDLLQRTGFVNLRSGELATRVRDMHQGASDLRGDVAAVRAVFTAPTAAGGAD
jgi:hypothetical protein